MSMGSLISLRTGSAPHEWHDAAQPNPDANDSLVNLMAVQDAKQRLASHRWTATVAGRAL